MNVLVCVKRVPETGGRIDLTADEQGIDTRFLGFTVSPHEECAVEEAVRLVEAHGGSSTVLTLGPEAAADQLRDAMAIGVERAILLETDGADWDPIATAGGDRRRDRPERRGGHGPSTSSCSATRRPTRGDFQVGIRVAVALDRPFVGGVKALEIRDGVAAAVARRRGGWEVFELPLPAVVAVREGINLPRYPSVPGRLRAKKKEIAGWCPTARPAGPDKVRLRLPAEQERSVEILGDGPGGRTGGRRAARPDGARRAMILTFVEHDGTRPARSSLEALTMARRPCRAGRGPARGAPRRTGRDGPRWRARGVRGHGRPCRRRSAARDVRPGGLGTLPGPGRRDGAGRTSSSPPGPTVATRSSPMRRAMPVRPMAANCIEVGPGEPFRVTRQRWGGSLLEDATLDGPVRCLTVAEHVVRARGGRGARAGRGARRSTPRSATRPPRARRRAARAGGGQGLAGRRPGRRRRRARRRQRRGVRRARGAGRAARRRGRVSRAVTSAGWRPHADAGRPDRAPGSRPSSTSPAASAGRSSTSSAARRPRRSSPSTPIATRRS